VRRVVLRGDSNALGFGWSRRLGERAEVLRVARERNRQKDCNRSSREYLFEIHLSLPDLQIPATGKLRRFRPMWPVVALTHKANRCGMRNV